MEFTQILPRQKQLKNVKMTVTGKDKDIVNFYIPQDVLRELNWNENCRVFLFQNEFIFKVKKVDDDVKNSFKLSALSRNRGAKLQFKNDLNCDLENGFNIIYQIEVHDSHKVLFLEVK